MRGVTAVTDVRGAGVGGRLEHMNDKPPVLVHPPAGTGRRVEIRGRRAGTATGPRDLLEFLRRAGLDPDEVRLDDPSLIEWRGGGPDNWPGQL